jgi:maleate isomerase
MARLAAIAEFWIDKPVIAINTAIYWTRCERARSQIAYPVLDLF